MTKPCDGTLLLRVTLLWLILNPSDRIGPHCVTGSVHFPTHPPRRTTTSDTARIANGKADTPIERLMHTKFRPSRPVRLKLQKCETNDNVGQFNSTRRFWPRRRPATDRATQEELNPAFSSLTTTSSSSSQLMISAGVSAVLLNMTRRNREATTRALFFWRHAGPIIAHYRFAQWWLGTTRASKPQRDRVYGALHDRYAQPSLDLILQLRGLYVKLGQVLSARPDFVPIQYVDRFAVVQSAVPPLPIEEVERQVRTALRTDLGLEWEDVFESMEKKPLGSASIGQVHRAVLRSPWDKESGYCGGNIVAVKVMDSGAKSRFKHDFQVFKWLGRVALPGWKPFLEEMERQVMTEFDYRNEAASLEQVRNNNSRSRYARQIKIPQPIQSLCCKHLLIMEMLEGDSLVESIEQKLTAALGGDETVARDFLQRKQKDFFLEKEIADRSFDKDFFRLVSDHAGHTKGSIRRWFASTVSAVRLLSLYRQIRHYTDLLVDVHGHQILVDGCFNGDPHPGNCLLLHNGKLGLIDYGQTRRLPDDERVALARVVSALGTNPVNVKAVAHAMRELGFRTKHDRDDTIAKYAALFFDSDHEAKLLGCATPQLYLIKLSGMDPLITVPDPAVFVARASFLFRGMGAMLDEHVQTSKRWRHHADTVLREFASTVGS